MENLIGRVDICDKCTRLSVCKDQGFVNNIGDMDCDYFKPLTKGVNMEETVKKWIEQKEILTNAKVTELALRNEIAAHILQDKIKGAKKGVIGAYKLTATAKLNAKIDKEALKAIWKDLSPAEKQAVKFDPKIVAAKYKTLDAKCMIHQTITHKPGTPGLELKGVIG